MIDQLMKRELKSKAHNLKPVVMIGNDGYSEAVKNEIERALHDHELIKVRVSDDDRVARRLVTDAIITNHHAELIGSIGHVIIIYRKRKQD